MTNLTERCIHHLFEAQTERTPDAVAVIYLSPGSPPQPATVQQSTYRELNQRANQLAHYLQARGVTTETLVGLCVERSLEMTVGLLAILKAGGAYVPLDPTYPRERLAFMLADTGVPVLLTQERLVEDLPEHQARLVRIDTDWSSIAQESAENPAGEVNADNLAYVIYTSGSTGLPKGVLAPHRGAVNRFAWMWQTYPFEAGEVCCQKTTLSFVDSIWEIFGPLLQGVPNLIVPDEIAREPRRLVQTLSHYGVTRIVVVPSLLRAILDSYSDLPRRLPKLKYWTSSGEALSLELWQRFQQSMPESILLNLYGSSEVAADATWYDTRQARTLTSVPIGRPITNMQVYILDDQLQPLPPGEVGELYVSGVGLARGYLNRPELTAERFIRRKAEGGRMKDKSPSSLILYKTGDLARYLPDGNIEFMGRADHQVKLRGFRIELGEIQAVLSQHPAVKQTVVIIREDTPGEKRLVAYIVPKSKGQAEIKNLPGELRRHLAQKLPDPMIPATFVLLGALPLTPNGKVDQLALPAPGPTRPDLAEAYLPPRTPVEKKLAHLWAEVLQLERVGIHDDFFALGGHSLLATQLIARVYQHFQVELSLRRLLETPTIAGLAEVLGHLGVDLTVEPPEPRPEAAGLIKPEEQNSPAPLSFTQERLWFLAQLEPDSPAYNLPLAYRLSGSLNIAALEQSLGEIVRRHEILWATFDLVDGQPVQLIGSWPNGLAAGAIPLVDLQHLPKIEREAEAHRLVTSEVQRPFDLAQGPLLRAKLLRLSPTDHIWLVIIHHLVFDGWSMDLFNREVTALYTAFVARQPSPLPELTIQYTDYARWQRRRLQGAVLEAQLSYWRRQLSNGVPALQLPTDHPRPALLTSRGATCTFTLPQMLSEQVKALSQQQGVTLFMALLAAFEAMLYYYTGGQTDFAVGSPIANRQQRETEELLGLFVNTLVLRARLSGNPTFWELLTQVREVVLDGHAHQEAPFQILVDKLQPKRDLSRTPLFQVWFGLDNDPIYSLNLPGLTVHPVEFDSGAVRHDLKLGLIETSTGLKGSIEYRTDLFEAATIARLANQYEMLLQNIVAQPNIHLNALVESLATMTERERKRREQELEQVSLRKLKQAKRKVIALNS